MPKKKQTNLHVTVEIDYEKLAQAIRDAMKASITVSSGTDARTAALAAVKRLGQA